MLSLLFIFLLRRPYILIRIRTGVSWDDWGRPGGQVHEATEAPLLVPARLRLERRGTRPVRIQKEST
jgi:hypothetical protein